MKTIVRSVCQACHCECGVLVHVDNGRVTKIDGDPKHPMNRGFTCIKGRAYADFLYHPDRLKYPLRRAGQKGEGKWQRVSWDEALGEIAEKLTEVRQKYGPESFATAHGTYPRASKISTALLACALGSPNTFSTDLHICFAPGLIGEIFTHGNLVMLEDGVEYEGSNCVLVWGANPVTSHPAKGKDILEAKTNGKIKLVVVDPRRTTLASKADMWLQLRPGTDCALALGMLNVIINEGLYDADFVSKWCHGFDQLKKRASEYPPEKVSEITWVPATKIREAAEMYASTKPAVIHRGVGIDQNINSTQTCRALSALVAITGNLDVPGGNLFSMKPPGYMNFPWDRFKPDGEVIEKRIGAKEFPLVSGPDAPIPFVPAPLWIEALSTGRPYPIKAMFCAGGNPLLVCQETKRLWEGLKKLDLFFVADFFMTPTAELADYVLPANTWLERNDCCDMLYTNYISARQKAIEPLYECWDDLKIAIELVTRISWADRQFIPWNDVREFNEWQVSGMGVTFEEFKKKGYIVVPRKYKKYEEEGFNTPSKKVELYSTVYERHGYDPLPSYKEVPQSPVSTPELLDDYPLILITGSRHIEYFNSEGRQIKRLRQQAPDPEIEIHPEAARSAGIQDGDWVWIETPMIKGERVKFRAKLTTVIDPRVVQARHGWWFPEQPAPEHGCFDSNISVVLSDRPPREEVCGSVPIRGTLCRVYKTS